MSSLHFFCRNLEVWSWIRVLPNSSRNSSMRSAVRHRQWVVPPHNTQSCPSTSHHMLHPCPHTHGTLAIHSSVTAHLVLPQHTHTHTLNKNNMANIHQTHMCTAEGSLRGSVYLWSQCRLLLFWEHVSDLQTPLKEHWRYLQKSFMTLYKSKSVQSKTWDHISISTSNHIMWYSFASEPLWEHAVAWAKCTRVVNTQFRLYSCSISCSIYVRIQRYVTAKSR